MGILAYGARRVHPLPRAERRKVALVSLGQWAVVTGRGWLVQAVHRALKWEGLTNV